MTGRSLLPILLSDREGRVDPSRNHVVVGRERHVARARTGHLPYPMRAIRTDSHLYIRNFRPDRWPMGTAPGFGAPDGPMPSSERLTKNTFCAFGDLDASPTKAWMVLNRDKSEVAPYFQRGMGRRPAEELYDLGKDPSQLINVAKELAYAEIRRELSDRLLKILRETGDPRMVDDGKRYENPPYAGEWKRK